MIGRWVAKILAVLIIGYAILLIVLWIAQWVISEDVPGMGVVKSFLHLLLIPSLVILPLLLLFRKWRLALVVLPVVVAFFISYGIFFIPRGAEVAANEEAIRIATFNLQAPDEAHVASIAEAIATMDADVVALQELSPAAAEHFEDVFADQYPYRAFHVGDEYVYAGQGVMSRYPLADDAFWRYEELEARSLGHQRVTVEAPAGRFVLYNTHPLPPYGPSTDFTAGPHQAVLEQVLARALDETEPMIMVGDFNMTDQFHAHRRITQKLADAYRAAGDIGFGFTFPYGQRAWLPPLVRLDYIFYSPEFAGIAADVGSESGSSDHRPVWARLTLERL